MKNSIIVLGVLVLLFAGAGFVHASEEITGDVGLNIATGPISGYGTAFGPNFGVNIDYGVFIKSQSASNITGNIKFRIDLGYYKHTDSVYGNNVNYTRIPVFVGGRYFFSQFNELAFYGEGGLEISSDSRESGYSFNGRNYKSSYSETRTGIAAGAGLTFNINPKLYVGANARLHSVSDNFFTLGGLVGYRFQ